MHLKGADGSSDGAHHTSELFFEFLLINMTFPSFVQLMSTYTDMSGSWINSTADAKGEPRRCLITLQGRSRWS